MTFLELYAFYVCCNICIVLYLIQPLAAILQWSVLYSTIGMVCRRSSENAGPYRLLKFVALFWLDRQLHMPQHIVIYRSFLGMFLWLPVSCDIVRHVILRYCLAGCFGDVLVRVVTVRLLLSWMRRLNCIWNAVPAPLVGVPQPHNRIPVTLKVVSEPCHGLLGCVNCKANSVHEVGLFNAKKKFCIQCC